MVEYWKSLKKHYCIYCKMYLVENPANRRHHEQSEKHKKRLQAAVEEARFNAPKSDNGAKSSFYEADQKNSRGELVFGQKHTTHPTVFRPFSMHVSAAPEIVPKKASTTVSFKFTSKPSNEREGVKYGADHEIQARNPAEIAGMSPPVNQNENTACDVSGNKKEFRTTDVVGNNAAKSQSNSATIKEQGQVESELKCTPENMTPVRKVMGNVRTLRFSDEEQ